MTPAPADVVVGIHGDIKAAPAVAVDLARGTGCARRETYVSDANDTNRIEGLQLAVAGRLPARALGAADDVDRSAQREGRQGQGLVGHRDVACSRVEHARVSADRWRTLTASVGGSIIEVVAVACEAVDRIERVADLALDLTVDA